MIRNSKMFNYELIRQFLSMHENQYFRKCEIAELTGLSYIGVHNVILKAWKLGWVTRIQTPVHNRAFEGKVECYKTQYKIKRKESWMGITPLFNQVMQNEKKNRKN